MWQPQPFSYTPNENDPELAVLRRRALFSGQMDQRNTIDELNRAGLFGSGAAAGVLGESQARTNRGLEDVDANTFARRRMEALQLYRDQAEFERQWKMQEEANKQAKWGALMGLAGDIGTMAFPAAKGLLAGKANPMGMSSTGMYTPATPLPTNALYDASYYNPSMPMPRRVSYM